jgi:hypothetical protein
MKIIQSMDHDVQIAEFSNQIGTLVGVRMNEARSYVGIQLNHNNGRMAAKLDREGVNTLIAMLAEARDIVFGSVTITEKSPKSMVRSLSPQAAKVLQHLKDVGTISAMEASTIYKVRALPRRIADLKSLGYAIKSELKTDHEGQRYARYSLV